MNQDATLRDQHVNQTCEEAVSCEDLPRSQMALDDLRLPSWEAVPNIFPVLTHYIP